MFSRRSFVHQSTYVLAGGILAGIATPAQASELVPTLAKEVEGAFKAADWVEMARICRDNGDVDALRAVSTMACRAQDFTQLTEAERVFVRQYVPRRQPRNAATTIVKKAILAVLRYGAHKMPARIRPIAWKIVEVVETTTEFQEFVIAAGLQRRGVDHALAWEAARWVVVFGGF